MFSAFLRVSALLIFTLIVPVNDLQHPLISTSSSELVGIVTESTAGP